MEKTNRNNHLKKQLKRFLLSLSNVSRSAFISVFGLIVNYILLHDKSLTVLTVYVYCISAVNLLIVFANWGGKDHAIKTLTQYPDKVPELINAILNSRMLLSLVPLLVVLFLPVSIERKVFIAVFLVLKVFNSFFETLITIRKKFHSFLLLDLILYIAFIGVILFDGNKTNPDVFLFEFLGIEFIRLILNLAFFRKLISFQFSFKDGINIIKTSAPFFYISLAGFVCSRADLYVVGLRLDKQQMSLYFIILNLMSLSQVGYSTFISTYASTIFRYSTGSFNKFARTSVLTGLVFSLLASMGIYILCTYYYEIPFSSSFVICTFINVFIFTQVLTEMIRFTRLEKQSKVLLCLTISGIINVLLAFLLSPYFGILGAFIANTTSVLCTYVLLSAYQKFAVKV